MVKYHHSLYSFEFKILLENSYSGYFYYFLHPFVLLSASKHLSIQYRHLYYQTFDCYLHELETPGTGKSKKESDS